MKCPLFSGCCSSWLLIIGVLITIGAIAAYLKCKKCCAPQLPAAKTMQPAKITMLNLRYPFSLPKLPYDYNALEPHVDAETMQIHHTKHHQAYVDNLNKALAEAPEFTKYTIDELMENIDALPASIRERVRNHGGGHFNHTLFWEMMSAQGGGQPSEPLLSEIAKYFGSFQTFKEQFEKAAQSRFGSGWAFLCVMPDKKLTIISTPNQDTPLAQGLYPILALDVWEHAYYLKYRNKRPDYISAWWNVVNWKYVENRYNDGPKTTF